MFAMTKHVLALSVLVCVVQADDTCNQVSKYMVANKQEYSQRLAKIPGSNHLSAVYNSVCAALIMQLDVWINFRRCQVTYFQG